MVRHGRILGVSMTLSSSPKLVRMYYYAIEKRFAHYSAIHKRLEMQTQSTCAVVFPVLHLCCSVRMHFAWILAPAFVAVAAGQIVAIAGGQIAAVAAGQIVVVAHPAYSAFVAAVAVHVATDVATFVAAVAFLVALMRFVLK